jgi:hypothetical protein
MSIIVECYTCHQLTTEQNTQPIRLLTPTGRNRNGYAVLSTSQVANECEACFAASTDEDTHLYIVSSCGSARTVGATTHEEAAVLFMRARGWRSTRSVAVCKGNQWTEYLDCQMVNGTLEYSKQVDLP